MLPAGKLPLESFFPAGTPVSISIPSSIVVMAYIWNFFSFTAVITSSERFKFITFCFGIITPCEPSSPRILQTWKNPSILSLTPPIG